LTAAVGSGRLPLILVALGSVVLFERRAAMEERKLARYEPAYAMYAARTWRLVPGLGRLAAPRATG
jgi:protein-S-isoprenylcysteine O-methyltransferase Ste14